MTFAALALVLALAAPFGGPPEGVVRGQVRSESTGTPLRYATVEVLDTQDPIRAVTDADGDYVLTRVPAGRHIIRATHLDHAPFELEIIVPAGGQLTVDLSLVLKPLILPPVEARSAARPGTDTVAAAAPELSAASIRVLEATPGMAEMGLTQAARGLPGNDPADPSDVLYVRGAASDLKLVLLDGAPVYSPFHVGGLVNAFEPDVLKDATLYIGGAPAKYDGGLSYVMDLETRAGRRDAQHASGAMDLLAGRALVDGPITSHAGYMIGGRGVHGLGAEPLMNSAFPYTYADGLARVDVDLGAETTIRATGFWNREAVRLDPVPGGDDVADWGNTAGSVRLNGHVAGGDGEFTAAYGDFQARLPVGGEEPLIADGVSRRLRLTADLSRRIGPAALAYGASFDRVRIQYRGGPAEGSGADSVMLDARAEGHVLGAYVDGSWHPVSSVQLRAGLRADLFNGESAPRFGPRFSARWLVNDHASLTLAAGEYHQYVGASEAAIVAPSGDGNVPVRPVPPLVVARASHLVLGLDQDVAEGVRLGLQGYYKTFAGIPAAGTGTDSRARASGVDLWIRRTTGRFTGWLGYSLGWVWSLDQAQPAVSDLFAGSQLLSAGLSGRLLPRTQFDVRVGYGAGLPYTAVPRADISSPGGPAGGIGGSAGAIEDAPSSHSGPGEPYLRLDAEVSRTFAGECRGVDFELTPYLRVLNALDRRDALFYQFDRARDNQPRALAALPVLPIVGVSWRF